jgi:hypothetical protein
MGKLDPRAEVNSLPPTDDFSVDRVAVPKTAKRSPIAEPPPAPAADAAAVESSVVSIAEREPRADADGAADSSAESSRAKKVTSQDPRYEPIEKLLDLNDWKKITDELGPMSDVGKLPPNLGLLAALAHNEAKKDGDPDAVATAIRCMAGLLGVADDSPIARVLARRMLRKNPVKLSERQAPPARTSLMIVVATLVVGGGVGWLASESSWRAVAHLLHLR